MQCGHELTFRFSGNYIQLRPFIQRLLWSQFRFGGGRNQRPFCRVSSTRHRPSDSTSRESLHSSLAKASRTKRRTVFRRQMLLPIIFPLPARNRFPCTSKYSLPAKNAADSHLIFGERFPLSEMDNRCASQRFNSRKLANDGLFGHSVYADGQRNCHSGRQVPSGMAPTASATAAMNISTAPSPRQCHIPTANVRAARIRIATRRTLLNDAIFTVSGGKIRRPGYHFGDAPRLRLDLRWQ